MLSPTKGRALLDRVLAFLAFGLLELGIEAGVKRCGRAVRFIVSSTEESPAQSQDNVQLIQALAQAQLWLEQLLRGETSSLRGIAQSARLSERYVSQIMRCAFLAPDLIEAILQGREPPGLTLASLVKHLPVERRMPATMSLKTSTPFAEAENLASTRGLPPLTCH
jgi:hypothetical protein